MTEIPEDFRNLLPKLAAEPDPGPVYYLWVFDPHNDRVILAHNRDKKPADHADHVELAKQVPHPERVHGYAYRIRGGWRVTTWAHVSVDDPHVLEVVRKKLNEENA